MSDRKIAQVAEGQVKGAMTRLKELSPELRVQVIEICEKHTYKGAEPLVEQLVGFACSSNVLCRFRKWHNAQEELVLGKDRVRQMIEFLKVQMPEVSAEKLKEMGVMFFTLMALARDDAKAFVTVTRTEIQNKREQLREKKLELDERKFKQSLRNKLDTGLDALGTHFKKNPEAMGHFRKAREALGSKEAANDECSTSSNGDKSSTHSGADARTQREETDALTPTLSHLMGGGERVPALGQPRIEGGVNDGCPSTSSIGRGRGREGGAI